jgi:uncharacterized membrane protein YdbT with pleckstrin-like domain
MIEIDDNEIAYKVVRRHWIVIVFNAISLFVVACIPLFLLALVSLIPTLDIFTFTGAEFSAIGFFISVWLLVVWMIAFNMWTDYYLDVLIITNKRIFDIEQYGLFRRRSSAFRLDRIQNISVNVKGIVQTLLDYGTMRFETAGEHEDFVAPYVPSPYEIKKYVGGSQDKEMDSPRQVSLDDQSWKSMSKTSTRVGEKMLRDDDGL